MTEEWKRNMYALCAGLFFAMAGMNAAIPFFPLFVRELGVEDPHKAHIWSGLIQAAPFFLSVFTVPLWGSLADRYGRKLLTVRAALGLALFTLLMGFSRDVTDLFVLRILQGAVAGFVSASLSLVSASAPQDRAGYAMGMMQTAIATGSIFGPLLGGVLADHFGMRTVMFIVAGLCFTGAFVVAVWVREKRVERRDEHFSPIANLKFVLNSKEIFSVVVLIGAIQLATSFGQPIFPAFVHSLGAPEQRLATIVGLLAGITGVCNAIFAPAWGNRSDRLGHRATLALTLPLMAFAIGIQGAMPSYLWLFPSRIVIGICAAGVIPSLYAALSKVVPTHRSSGVIGVASSAHLIGNCFGPLLGSAIAVFASEPACFFVAGSLTMLAYLGLAKRLPKEVAKTDSLQTSL